MIHDNIIELISRSNSIVVVSHINGDGDSLGSIIAFKRAFTRLGKDIYLPAPEVFPRRYAFMQRYTNGWRHVPRKCDLIVALDCSISERIDWGKFQAPQNVKLINIDHHDGNPNFGDFNWVEPSVSAVGELVFELLEEFSAPIDESSANALYTAIMTDTGRFSFGNTTSHSMQVAAKLIALGADPKYLTTEIYFNFSEEYLRNIGIALFNSRSFHDGRILFLTLDKATTRNFSTSLDDSEGIIDFAMAVRNVDIAALFKELEPDRIRVSMRSRRGVAVNEIAKSFGGGGHPNAAGCTISGNLAIVQQAILTAIKKLLGYDSR